MKILQEVTQDLVLGEFLKNEFYESDYNRDRDLFEQIVLEPNFADPTENAIRRALLFRRRGHMWRELPADTRWWQVELDGQDDLKRIHVFPRAHWRRVSNGSFCLSDIVTRIRNSGYRHIGEHVAAKLQQLRYRIQANICPESTILLIGINETLPMTILEGNHRLTAAMLASPDVVRKHFRIMCGFSPNMTKSCWYKTNFDNLARYAWHRFINLYDRQANVRRHRFEPARATSHTAASSLAVENLTETRS